MKTTVHATGVVFFQGFGDYGSTIVLTFADADAAARALPALGRDWHVKGKHVGCRVVDPEATEAVETLLRGFALTFPPCGWRHCNKGKGPCEAKSPFAMFHSIDRGPGFTVDVPAEAPIPVEQGKLFP